MFDKQDQATAADSKGVSYYDLWTEHYGQEKIIKRLEHAPSGLTEGKIENINRELELLGETRR